MIFLLTAESEFAVGWKPRASDSALILADMNPCEWADPTHSLISVHTSALRPTARTCRPLAINNFVFVIVGLSARFWAGHVIIIRQSPFSSGARMYRSRGARRLCGKFIPLFQSIPPLIDLAQR